MKLYYFVTFHRAKFTALHDKLIERGLESPYAERLKEWVDDDDEDGRRHEITTRVQCADYFELRDQALIAHATQVDPNGGWFACPVEIQREAWPTEDYHLARSLVDTSVVNTENPECDLFAGIREKVRQ